MRELKEIIYCHEHTTIDLSGIKQDDDCKLDSIDETIQEFKNIKMKNVSTIIDVTNRGMGRNVFYTDNVSKKIGVKILHSTGYYKEPFLPQEVYNLSIKELEKIMVSEIVDGIDGSSIKASVIGEIGTSLNKIEDMEFKVLKAASRASVETGTPIVTHTTLGRLGMEQIEVFKRLGVDLSKVILSHIDLSGDVDYMMRLLNEGVNIAFDTIGKNNYQLDEMRIKWLKELIKNGYDKQIVMSMDITRKSNFKNRGGIGYSYLIDEFIPQLYKTGVKMNYIENLICNNIKNIIKH